MTAPPSWSGHAALAGHQQSQSNIKGRAAPPLFRVGSRTAKRLRVGQNLPWSARRSWPGHFALRKSAERISGSRAETARPGGEPPTRPKPVAGQGLGQSQAPAPRGRVPGAQSRPPIRSGRRCAEWRSPGQIWRIKSNAGMVRKTSLRRIARSSSPSRVRLFWSRRGRKTNPEATLRRGRDIPPPTPRFSAPRTAPKSGKRPLAKRCADGMLPANGRPQSSLVSG
jgi:hypothetical protein